MSMNKSLLVGNLGATPELRYTGSGQPVCSLRLATDESYRDKDGNKKTNTQWHRVVVWGKTAENCCQYLTKGRQVLVEGRMQTRKWTDKDGLTRFTTEVVATRVDFLGSAPRASQQDEPPLPDEDPANVDDQDVDVGETVGPEAMVDKLKSGDARF